MFNKFIKLLESEDKEKCVNFILEQLKTNKITIIPLYEEILKPSLNTIECSLQKQLCIWKEHVRSSIIRGIIECCYPYVLKEKKTSNNKTIVIMCPDGEYHEIGARMITDIFTIYGFVTIFVGANNPKSEFIDVINIIKPDYIAISVTSFYNLVSAEKTITDIRVKSNYDIKIIVGGNAFKDKKNLYKDIGADILIKDNKDIENTLLKSGDNK